MICRKPAVRNDVNWCTCTRRLWIRSISRCPRTRFCLIWPSCSKFSGIPPGSRFSICCLNRRCASVISLNCSIWHSQRSLTSFRCSKRANWLNTGGTARPCSTLWRMGMYARSSTRGWSMLQNKEKNSSIIMEGYSDEKAF